MTNSTVSESLPINPRHVQLQFNRAQRPDEAEFLYGEIANRMLDRLRLIRLTPSTMLDAGCGFGARTAMLRQRYPQTKLISQDHHEGLLKRLRQEQGLDSFKQKLRRLRSPILHETLLADLAQTQLSAESIELVWSNLALHWHPRVHDVIREWGRILQPEGLAFFSYFGPGTAIELRRAIATAQLETEAMPFVDMHDLGDMLIEHGFADPVMDQEVLTLTYEDPQTLLRDARVLGGNANNARRANLVSKGWLARLMQALESQRNADGHLTLTLEICYGHAWRRAIRQLGTETRISLQSIGRRQSSDF
ncbi:methyltransferase domain-containing protein [Orrella sp. 11846]|uniref:methyltransferase domain-containing protein n=1 Tax=Orrella sp. 11846 TaxID=3409913 RepID=UPI003B599AC0